jgi:hypothetical protein
MILRGNMLCSRVQNERDQTGMPGRKPNEDTLASPAIPLRDFLAILQTRVKHVNRTAKDMGTW